MSARQQMKVTATSMAYRVAKGIPQFPCATSIPQFHNRRLRFFSAFGVSRKAKKKQENQQDLLPVLLIVARFGDLPGGRSLLALNIDAQRDVFVTWQHLNHHCLGAA